jgi:hypothetical protein
VRNDVVFAEVDDNSGSTQVVKPLAVVEKKNAGMRGFLLLPPY